MNILNMHHKLADKIERSISNPKEYTTLANVCIKTGINIKDAEKGILFLINKYNGTLTVTTHGELAFKFPHGFKKKWISKYQIPNLMFYSKKKLMSLTKILIRSWISFVLIFYLFFFVGVLCLFLITRSNKKGESLPFYFLIRTFLDSIYWMTHPLSSFTYKSKSFSILNKHKNQSSDLGFSSKVNQFVFGTEKKESSILSLRKKILQHIKINNGYTNIYDIMKIVLLPKKDIQNLLAILVLDYNGCILVNKIGSVTYYFPQLVLIPEKKTLSTKKTVSMVWIDKTKVPQFTGNSLLSNILIVGINSFNLYVSVFIINNNLTISKIKHIVSLVNFSNFDSLFVDNIYESTPILLGWMPFVFSIAIFTIPVIRLLYRKKMIKKINAENGYKSLLKYIIVNIENGKFILNEIELIKAWSSLSDEKTNISELSKTILKIGGEMKITPKGSIIYVFSNLMRDYIFLQSEKSKLRLKKLF